MVGEPLTVLGACHHDCPDTCAWEVTVSKGVATRLRGSGSHPVTRGSLCPKVNRYLDRVYHPDRVLTPLRRVGPKGSGEFEAISWDDAIALMADRIRSRMDAGCPESILQFSFAGTQGLVQMGTTIDRLFDLIGAADIRRELCGVTAFRGAARVLGTPFSIDPESMRHARTIVLWGTDTRMTNRHLWATVEAARHAGATVIVIDPVRTETARAADVHLAVRPGTDTALVLGLIRVLDREDLLDRTWIAEHTTGWAALQESAQSWTPEQTEAECGLPDGTVEWLARLLATQTPTALRTLVGPEHRRGGEEILRAITMLAAVLGAWREVGGGLARSTAAWADAALAKTPRVPRRKFNMARLGEVLIGADPDWSIDTLVVHNCNPAVVLPAQQKVLEGLSREDLFTVVIDQFITDTASFADLVLPATTQIEQLDLVPSWGHLYLALNQPAITPRGESLPNSEIARRLGRALGLDDPLLERSDEQVIRDALASGHPLLDGITYESLVEHGWQRLAVPADARLYVDDIPGVSGGAMRLGALEPIENSGAAGETQPYPLTLISRKQVRTFLNSHYGGFADHLPPSGEPMLQIHAEDAQARDIRNGDRVRVSNDQGELTLGVQISDQMQPGLVAIPFGWWNSSTPQRRSVNLLTNAAVREDDRGSAYFHDTYVEVERCELTGLQD